jgi:DNA-binding IclR family transcriptional regulator
MSNGVSYRIGSLERAFSVLEAIADLGGATLAELAVETGAPKPSLLRHLRVLETAGYVTMNPELKRYALGARLIHLGYAARQQLGLVDVSAPLMRDLRDRFDETVHLGVLSHGDVLHVAVVPSRQPLKMATPVGEWTFAHVSALGKVLLAWGNGRVLGETLAARGLPRLTERTIVDPNALKRELDGIRSKGWAVDNEESALGLRCVAAPVRDASGHVTAALSVSAPATRLSQSDIRQVGPAVVRVASLISERLGYQPGAERERRRGLVDAAEHELAVGQQTLSTTGTASTVRGHSRTGRRTKVPRDRRQG